MRSGGIRAAVINRSKDINNSISDFNSNKIQERVDEEDDLVTNLEETSKSMIYKKQKTGGSGGGGGANNSNGSDS